MTNTMNPVDLYHDPSLDGLIHQSDNLRRTTSVRRKSNGAQERRPMQENMNVPERMPYGPEVPRGPPIAYRGPPPDALPQRSFSQRAKGRPYAREAFADDEQNAPVEGNAPVRQSPQEQHPPTGPVPNRARGQENLRLDTGRPMDSGSRRSRQSQATPSENPVQIQSQANGRQHTRAPSNTNQYMEQPLSAVSRSSAARADLSALDDQRRDWAPDRSPLQKLEVTLNDISKEEKRARVQEAEILLRESKAKRVISAGASTQPRPANVSSQRSAPPRQAAPAAEGPTIEDAGLVRNLSSAHRNRLQHSTVIDNHRPDTRRPSGEGARGFDYSASKPRDESSGAYAITPCIGGDQRGPRHPEPPGEAVSRSRRVDENADVRRAVSAKDAPSPQSGGNAVPSNITRAVSMQGQQPHPRYREDDEQRPAVLAERERNASHKATLAKLTGSATPVAAAHTGSRKLQKAPPADFDRSRTRPKDIPQRVTQPPMDRTKERQDPRGYDESRSAAVYTPPQQQAGKRDLVGLGVAPTSPPTSSPMSTRTGGDQPPPRQRRTSVTFKEPAVRRPVDEWRDAKTARLSLADFAFDSRPESSDRDQTWWESNPDSKSRRRSKTRTGAGLAGDPIDEQTAQFSPQLFLRCGPLLRYTGMKRTSGTAGGSELDSEVWRGSVMIVTQDSHSSYQQPPTLRLFSRPKAILPPPPSEVTGGELAQEYVDPIAGLEKISRIGRALYVRPVDHLEECKDLSSIENDNGLFESSPSLLDVNGSQGTTTATTNRRTADQDGEHLGRYQEVEGARLYADPDRDVTFWRFNIEIELGDIQQHIAYRINRGASSSFWVPARGQTMNIMFHSCNGFSVSVKPDQFSGPDPLWRDVLNVHQTRPFHVMIGGGDQIYNDRVRLETQHFGDWTQMKNPHHKHEAPFAPEMKDEVETFYLNRYAMWFSQGLFGMASSQIPMVNVWDDHDIIDGFGSYPDHFMKSPVFSGVGNVAFKYYMLFQHQSVPEETATTEPSWVLGHEPGPYIHQLSRSLFMHMGKHVAFLGIDCRTERMRDEILSIRTFDLLLERCRKEIVEGETKHLIVLLGVPIAYPRLVWLENVLTSKAMDPIKALGRAGVLKSGFLNTFDGGIEILDDLDDHWTATHHKSERNDLIKDLQDLAAEKSVRITILGGDVHLAAIGQFYSNPKLKIPKDKDHRYMPNVISSAIVNTPPPNRMADMINKRDKMHHLDSYTDESMIPMFTHDVDHKKRNNTHLLPRRNWCSIREYIPGSTPPPSPPSTPSVMSDEDDDPELQDTERLPKRRFSFTRDSANPRGLLRRLSSRKDPPSSYRDNMPGQQHQSASYDGSQPTRANFFGYGRSASSGPRRASFNSQEAQRRASSFDQIPSGTPVRPGILRRPTNLSEKAVRKGNVPAIDAEGNEIDVNDHVNLDCGLDIVLNVEVNQKDPAGITTPYRLLVPALWYDGSSDREKLESGTGIHRKPTLLGRFGIGRQRQQKAAQKQGAGNWGQEMSDAESYADSEETKQKQPPRRRFSLFGSRRRKQEDMYSDDESDLDDNPSVGQQFVPPTQAQQAAPQIPAQRTPPQVQQTPPRTQWESPQAQQVPPQSTPQRHVSAPTSKAVQRAYETGQLQPQSPSSDPAPSQRMLAAGYQQPQTSKAVQRLYETGQLQPSTARGPPSQNDALYDTTNRPPSQHHGQHQRSSAPRRTMTIGSQQNRAPAPTRSISDNYPIQAPTSPPQSRGSQFERQNQFNAPPQPQGQPQYHFPPSTNMPQRRLSKQERILGIGGAADDYQPPGQQPLRGNGIIGGQDAHAHETSPRGYSGIEAYKDPGKPRRGFSFKKARDWLDGRRNRNDYDDYDDYDEYEEQEQGQGMVQGPGQGQRVY